MLLRFHRRCSPAVGERTSAPSRRLWCRRAHGVRVRVGPLGLLRLRVVPVRVAGRGIGARHPLGSRRRGAARLHVPSDVRPLLVGRIFSVLAVACRLGTEWAGFDYFELEN